MDNLTKRILTKGESNPEKFMTEVMGVKLPPHTQELIKKMNAMPKGSTYQLICARPNAKRYLENAIAEIAGKVAK